MEHAYTYGEIALIALIPNPLSLKLPDNAAVKPLTICQSIH